MKHPFILVAFLIASSTFAQQSSDELGKLRESYTKAVERATAPLKATYIAELQKLMEKQTKAGNLDAALATRTELAVATKADPISTSENMAVLAPPIPAGTSEVAKGRYKLVLIKEQVTWDEAKQKCITMGGQLAWFTDMKELELLKELADEDPNLEVWLGGSRSLNTPGPWTWPDGSQIAAEIVGEIGYNEGLDRPVLRANLAKAAISADGGGSKTKFFVCKIPR